MGELSLTWLSVFGLILSETLLFPGIMIGVYRSVNNILGYSNERLFGDSEKEFMGFVSMLILAVGICCTIWGGIFALIWYKFANSPYYAYEMTITTGAIIGLLGLIHVGLARRRNSSQQLYIEIVSGLGGIICGGIICGAGEVTIRILGAVFGGLGGLLIGRTVGKYANKASSGHADFFGNIAFSAIVGGLTGGIINGLLSGVLSAGGAEVLGTHWDIIFGLGVYLGGIAGVIVGGLFGGLARPITNNISRKTAVRKIKLFSGLSLCLFVSGIAAGFVNVHVAGGNTSLPGALPGIFFGGIIGGLSGCFFGGIAGGIVSGITDFVLFTTRVIGKIVSFVVSSILAIQKFKPVICSHCFRYTLPLKSRYEYGLRYCEHCRKEVERTNAHSKVILTFGAFPLRADDRTFVLPNPDFEQKEHPIEISEVYIDTITCDKRLLERFITYILNYPPKKGLRLVQIFYRGELSSLGENLKNVLRNNFDHVKALHSDMQQHNLQTGNVREHQTSPAYPNISQKQAPAAWQGIRFSLWKPLMMTTIMGLIVLPIIGFIAGVHSLLIPINAPQIHRKFTFYSSRNHHMSSIRPMSDGGYIVTGIPKPKGTAWGDAWVVKLDAQWRKIWERTFSVSGMDWVNTIQPTQGRGCIVIGGTESQGDRKRNARIVRLDAQGGQAWEHTFDSSEDNWLHTIQPTPDEGYIAAGRKGENAWVLKLNVHGQQVWEYRFGDSNKDSDVHVIQPISDGGCVVVGNASSKGQNKWEAWVVKLNAQGQQMWKYTFDVNDYNRVYAIQPAPDGGYVMAGEKHGDALVVKLDARGQHMWERTFDNNKSDVACTIQPTPDGSYIVAGYTELGNWLRDNAWIFKLNEQGELVWECNFGGIGWDHAHAIQPTPDGAYMVFGNTDSGIGAKDNVWVFMIKPNEGQDT